MAGSSPTSRAHPALTPEALDTAAVEHTSQLGRRVAKSPDLSQNATVARKSALIAGIVLTAIAPLIFVPLAGETPGAAVLKLLAKAGSLSGTVLVLWQVALGFRRFLARWFPDLLWLLDVHKHVGRFGLGLILLHPIGITAYYVVTRGTHPLDPNATAGLGFVVLGFVALGLFGVLAGTSFFIQRMGFRPWFGIHLLAYPAVALVFVHAIPLGSTLRGSVLGTVWWALAVTFLALCVLRIGARLTSPRFAIASSTPVGDGAREIALRPAGRIIAPHVGQFVQVRRGPLGLAHPYSVSRFDPITGELSITVKSLGPFSEALQHARPGERLVVDGPYGRFTQDAIGADVPVVVLAGGVGITPFMRLLRTRARGTDVHDFLFYGNKTASDILFRDELARIARVEVVHVLDDEPGHAGPTGFVSIELLREHLGPWFDRCVYLLCGPPPMVEALEAGLLDAGVPRGRVHVERFDF